MTTLTNRSQAEAGAFAVEAARLMADLKCEDVTVLDVRGLSQITNYLVIGSGTSERQMQTVGRDVAELGEELGFPVFRSNQDRASNWIVVDFVDVTVHVLDPNVRAFYDLEHLWDDAMAVEWKRSNGAARPGRPGVLHATDEDASE